ncbi:MAG: hypothetical protein U0324_13040 [Polyangiales bacterium]
MNRPTALLAAATLSTGCLSPNLNALLGGSLQLASTGAAVAASQQRAQPQAQPMPAMQPAPSAASAQGVPPPVVPQAIPVATPIGQAPTPYPGTVVIRVVNTSPVNICQVYMAPRGERVESGAWLAQGDMVMPGAAREFNVRDDKFAVRLTSCTGQALVDEPDVDFHGPRELAVYAGAAPTSQTPAGFRRIAFRASVSVGP